MDANQPNPQARNGHAEALGQPFFDASARGNHSIISIPAMAVQPGWQLPIGLPGQQQPNQPGTNGPGGLNTNPGNRTTRNQNNRDNKLRFP